MTHDPMCWLNEWGDLYKVGHLACECPLIAKVRADQRECCVSVIQEFARDTSNTQRLIAAIWEKS